MSGKHLVVRYPPYGSGGRLAQVVLNRTRTHNALSSTLLNDIDLCFQELEADDGVSAIVLCGTGQTFCAGFDTTELGPDGLSQLEDSASRCYQRLAQFGKPLIAAVNGPAMGGGLDLAVLCDVRIAAEHGVFAHPHVNPSILPLYRPLRDIVGAGLARDICLTGRHLGAKEAQRIGLVSKVVPGKELLDVAYNLAAAIAEVPLTALKPMKRQFIVDAASREDTEPFGYLGSSPLT